jgi:hypothetical protein
MSASLSTMTIGGLRRLLRDVPDSGWCTLATGELVALVERLAAAEAECGRLQTVDRFDAEMAWGIIANVSGGDWTRQSDEWREAAARWRDQYFAALRASPP